jgi:hypothetical protein
MHMSLSPVPELSKNSAFILIFLAHEKKKDYLLNFQYISLLFATTDCRS